MNGGNWGHHGDRRPSSAQHWQLAGSRCGVCLYCPVVITAYALGLVDGAPGRAEICCQCLADLNSNSLCVRCCVICRMWTRATSGGFRVAACSAAGAAILSQACVRSDCSVDAHQAGTNASSTLLGSVAAERLPSVCHVDNASCAADIRCRNRIVTAYSAVHMSSTSTSGSTPDARSDVLNIDGPGSSGILSSSLIAEHRTHQRFKVVRTPHPNAVEAAKPLPAQKSALMTAAAGGVVVPRPVDGSFPTPPSPLPGAHHTQYLLGCNVRCMLGWCRLAIARGYAFALYCDGQALHFASSPGLPSSAAGSNSNLALEAFLDAKERDPSVGEVSIVLMMARDIPGEHMSHGFRNSLLARLGKREKDRQRAATTHAHTSGSGSSGIEQHFPAPDRTGALATGKGAAGIPSSFVLPGVSSHAVSTDSSPNALGIPSELASSASSASSAPASGAQVSSTAASASASGAIAALTSFANAFNGWNFVSGDEVSLVWRNDGTLVPAVNGEIMPGGALIHPAVIRALFDVYCGDNAVSGRARDTFRSNYHAAASAASIVVPSTLGAAPAAQAQSGGLSSSPPMVLGPLGEMLVRAGELAGRAKKAVGLQGGESGVHAVDALGGTGSGDAGGLGGGGAQVDLEALTRIVLAEHASRTK